MSDTFLPGSGFDTYESQDKVLVQMDGSRECAVAVRILQQQGFAVAGAAVRLAAEQTADAESAKKAAEALGIECIVLNAEALAGQDADVLGEGGTPLFAALLKLFYRRKQMHYMWHFVHAIHLNTVFLILLCIPLVPLFAYGIDDMLAARQTLNSMQQNFLHITTIGFPVAMFGYLLVSFRTVYKQNWVTTTLMTDVCLFRCRDCLRLGMD